MELAGHEGVVAIQDLGAAGLTSSVAECAARAGSGARIDVAAVPRRERGMTPYEVMLSESQERMLLVVRQGWEAPVRAVFERWDLEAVTIGQVTGDGRLTVVDGEEAIARLPVQLLAEGAPARHLEGQAPDGHTTIINLGPMLKESLADPGSMLLRMLGSPDLCSRRPIFRRYDHMVGNATVIPPGGDAAVLRINGTSLGLAVTIDGNGRYCELDPNVGAQIAVCEAARNIVATGARPLGVTDCLNFGSPDRPDVYWQLEQAVEGIGTACRALGLPVVSGNVSLYNESDGGAIFPTPIIGMVGLLGDHAGRIPAGLQEDGDFILLVGTTHNDLGGSEYVRLVRGRVGGRPPALDLVQELAVQEFMLDAAGAGLLRSAHDVAEGGLLVALAETCLLGGIGARCAGVQPDEELRMDAVFFGESQGRFVISTTSRAMPELQGLARRHKVELTVLGLAGGERIEFERQLSVPLASLREAWETGLVAAMEDT